MEIVKGRVSKANYTEGRSGNKVEMVVIHTEQGTDAGTNAWFADPKAHSSAHYLVSFEGRITGEVPEDSTAWHAGNAHVNKTSIGIELEGFMERGRFPKPMMDSLSWLITQICDKYKIPRDRKHIIGHCEVPDPKHPGKFGGANNHKDPGPQFPWGALMTALGVPETTKEAATEPPPPAPPAPPDLTEPVGEAQSEPDELIAACEVCGGPSVGAWEVADMGPGHHDLCEGCSNHLPEEPEAA